MEEKVKELYYLLHHEDYKDLNIHQKIGARYSYLKGLSLC